MKINDKDKDKDKDKAARILRDVVWRCGDCKNIYSLDVKYCPNSILDEWLVNDVITLKDLEDMK